MISSSAVLEINTKNLAYNFKLLAKIANNSLPGATIKANAYGIGDIEAFNIFYKNHCRHFFLATVEEALAIRKKTSRGNIYVLNGLENNDLNVFYLIYGI
jgi:alanine racemase